VGGHTHNHSTLICDEHHITSTLAPRDITAMNKTAAPAPGTKKSVSIVYDRDTKKWLYDATKMAFDPKKTMTTEMESGKVFHISPTYHGNGFVKIVTPFCFCSGLFVNVDKATQRKTIGAAIWLYREWTKEKRVLTDVEKKHEKLWHELHKVVSLLDTPEYAELRRTIGVGKKDDEGKPKFMAKVVSPFVRLPKHKEGELAGEVDEDRPPRVKASVWLAKPKVTAGAQAKAAAKAAGGAKELKSVPDGSSKRDDATWEGQRLLMSCEMVNKEPCAMEDLFERPFIAKFTLIWTSDFFGAYKTHQVKISHICVGELLEKMTKAGMSDAERAEAMDEYAELREREDRAVEELAEGVVKLEVVEDEGDEPTPPPKAPKAAPAKEKERKKAPPAPVPEEPAGDDEEEAPKPPPTKAKKLAKVVAPPPEEDVPTEEGEKPKKKKPLKKSVVELTTDD
jgi:hypothetical protein